MRIIYEQIKDCIFFIDEAQKFYSYSMNDISNVFHHEKFEKLSMRNNNLNYGQVWDHDLVVKTVDEQHALLNLPPPIAEKDLPPKYVRFLATYKQGALPIAYTAATTARYKRDLAKLYGMVLESKRGYNAQYNGFKGV